MKTLVLFFITVLSCTVCFAQNNDDSDNRAPLLPPPSDLCGATLRPPKRNELPTPTQGMKRPKETPAKIRSSLPPQKIKNHVAQPLYIQGILMDEPYELFVPSFEYKPVGGEFPENRITATAFLHGFKIRDLSFLASGGEKTVFRCKAEGITVSPLVCSIYNADLFQKSSTSEENDESKLSPEDVIALLIQRQFILKTIAQERFDRFLNHLRSQKRNLQTNIIFLKNQAPKLFEDAGVQIMEEAQGIELGIAQNKFIENGLADDWELIQEFIFGLEFDLRNLLGPQMEQGAYRLSTGVRIKHDSESFVEGSMARSVVESDEFDAVEITDESGHRISSVDSFTDLITGHNAKVEFFPGRGWPKAQIKVWDL